jgi:hypothetical protein
MVSDYDTGKRTYGRIAYGSPYRGCPARYAAEQLLTKTLEDDRDVAWVAPPWYVTDPGLLDSDDIRRIGLPLFSSEHTAPANGSSPFSFGFGIHKECAFARS